VGDKEAGFHARRWAALAVGRANHRPAVPILAKVLEDETENAGIRGNMIRALQWLGGPDALKAIQSACTSRNEHVASSASEAVARLKDAPNKAGE